MSPHYFDAFVDLISMSNQIDSDLFEVGVCELGHVMQRRVTCVFEFDGVLSHADVMQPFFDGVHLRKICVHRTEKKKIYFLHNRP